jgi:HSP20 family protein
MALRDLAPWSRQENRLADPSRQQADHPLFSLHRDVNRLFDDVFRGFGMPGFGVPGFGMPSFAGLEQNLDWPKLELGETDNEIRVTAELPGLEEKDVEILVEDNALIMRGEKRSDTEDKERGYSERSYGRFERRIRLPREVEQDKANATFKNGVLTVTLPKSAKANENARRIPVNNNKAA